MAHTRVRPRRREATFALRSVEHGPGRGEQPEPAADQAEADQLEDARDHFADHCATCHGNDGGGKTAINDGLYPPAPDLRARATQELTDGELLDIIKNGIRFTGMPGWGGDDEENWKLILFIRHLPELSEKELASMRDVNREPGDAGIDHGHSSRHYE